MADRKDTIERGMEIAKDKITHVMDYLGQTIPKNPGIRRLSKREQLDRFLNMTPSELNELRIKYGETEIRKYINTMRQYARRI